MIRKISLIAFVASVSLASMAFAADPTPAKPAGQIIQPGAPVTPEGNVFFSDKSGTYFADPVCGMQPKVSDKTAHRDYDGKRYYFCSDGCAKAFDAKPAETLGKLVLPAYVKSMADKKMVVDCAVSGEKVTVNDKTQHQVYKGHDYYFCCDKCPKAFAKNPEKFAIGGAPKAPPAGMKMEGHDKH